MGIYGEKLTDGCLSAIAREKKIGRPLVLNYLLHHRLPPEIVDDLLKLIVEADAFVWQNPIDNLQIFPVYNCAHLIS